MSDDLLNDMLAEHDPKAPDDAEAEAKPAGPREPEVELERRRYAADPDAKLSVAGLRQGSVFTFEDAGEDLDGEWIVKQANPGHVFAERPAGGPPYIKLEAEVILEELEAGRLKLHN